MHNDNKNQLLILKVVESLGKNHPDLNVRLTLVGEGRCRESLEKYAQTYQIDDRVNFVNNQSPQELDQIYSQSDIFIFASLSEGSPNVILEAMSHSLPIVTSAVGSIEKMVMDGVTGYIVEFGNVDEFVARIAFLANNAKLLKKMGEKARERIENEYSIDQTVVKIENILFA